MKYLTTLPDARDRAYGEGLREALRELFAVIHRREGLSGAGVPGPTGGGAGRGVAARDARTCRRRRHSRNLAKRFEAHGESYFRFITTPGVEPTNNLAEQAIRFVVIDRLITQGTRSEAGNRWCERIWTVIATCSQQGRSVFAYLEAAVGGVVRGGRGAVAVTRRLRGREVRRWRWVAQVQGPLGPGSPEGRPPVTTSTRGGGSSCSRRVEAGDHGR